MMAIGAVVVAATLPGGKAFAADPTADDKAILQAPANAATVTAADREAAAARMIERNTPADKAALIDLLNNPVAQLAVARAMQFSPHPDPDAIVPLKKLLAAKNVPAAAVAIANIDSPAALAVLKEFVDGTISPIRPDVVRALGNRTDQPTAEYLVSLVAKPAEPLIQSAADDALARMTGFPAGGDPARWAPWWAGVKNLPANQFQAGLLEVRKRTEAAEREREKARIARLTQEEIELWHMIPPEPAKQDPARNAALIHLLRSADPASRLAALTLVRDQFENAHVYDPVKSVLRSMIVDPDVVVRLHVIEALGYLNDAGVAGDLVKQLAVEQDPSVKLKIAEVLAKFENDPAATAKLMSMVTDKNPVIDTAAAKAIGGRLGETLHEKDPTAAADASRQLRAILATQPVPAAPPAPPLNPAVDAYRSALVSALAALSDHDSYSTFGDVLNNPNESPDVRIWALHGLGNLKDTNANLLVADDLENTDKVVRFEAAKAFATTAKISDADNLYNHMMGLRTGNFAETDPSVMSAEWVAFQALFPQMSIDRIQQRAGDFRKANDSQKWLATLIVLGSRLEAAKRDEDVALNRLNIAQALMSVSPPRAHEAVENLQKAMDYFNGPGKASGNAQMTMASLVGDMITDLVADRQYAAAAAFGANQIKIDGEYHRTVDGRLLEAAKSLLQSRDKAGTTTLVDEVLKMNPPLSDTVLDDIRQIKDDAANLPTPR
jgi:HEAT repeat protein